MHPDHTTHQRGEGDLGQRLDDLVATMAIAAALGVTAGAAGLAISVAAHTAAGATVALVAAALFVGSAVFRSAKLT